MDACKQPVHACLATTWCTHAWPTLPGAICINALSTQDPNRTTCASCICTALHASALHLPTSSCIFLHLLASTSRCKHEHTARHACMCTCVHTRALGVLVCSHQRRGRRGQDGDGGGERHGSPSNPRRPGGLSPPRALALSLPSCLERAVSWCAVCLCHLVSWSLVSLPLVLSGLLQVRGHLSRPI
jgi:hypothetical protein